jgi:DNA-3-methyladenine glycosylase I
VLEEFRRCDWVGSDPMMITYHDEEWGVPEHDSRALWEKLALDGFQAGLSWRTILAKREAFRAGFAQFDPERVARFGETDIARLLADPGIVRSRAKIEATIGNAKAYLAMKDAGEDFAAFVWSRTGGHTIRDPGPRETKSALSELLSSELKRRGFKFVGPVVVYAWMQATGVVDGHAPGCVRRHAFPRTCCGASSPRAEQAT